jgi:hypothetical protein
MLQSDTTTFIEKMLCCSVNYVFQTYVFVTRLDTAKCTRRSLNRVKFHLIVVFLVVMVAVILVSYLCKVFSLFKEDTLSLALQNVRIYSSTNNEQYPPHICHSWLCCAFDCISAFLQLRFYGSIRAV